MIKSENNPNYFRYSRRACGMSGLPNGRPDADSLEAIFQRELYYARVHAGGRNLSEVPGPHVGNGICGSNTVVRIAELRMIEGVEEFGAELDRMILQDPDPFQ